MSVVHMETEWVREMTRRFQITAMGLDNQAARLRSASYNLNYCWQGGDATRFYLEFQTWIRRFQAQVQNLEYLSVRLDREVGQWECVDQSANFHERLSPWQQLLIGGSDIWSLYNSYMGDAALAAVLAGMVAGATYDGQVIFYGGQDFKKAAGLSPNLTHIKAANLPKHLLSQNKVSTLDYVDAAIDFTGKAAKDWSKYDDGTDKASALAYDAAFVTVKKGVEIGVKNWAGTAILIPLATAAVAAGAPALVVAGGALVAWWGIGKVVSWGMDEVYEWTEGSGFKDALVHGSGDAIDHLAEGEIVDAAEDLIGGSQVAGDIVYYGATEAVKSAADTVDSAFSSVSKFVAQPF